MHLGEPDDYFESRAAQEAHFGEVRVQPFFRLHLQHTEGYLLLHEDWKGLTETESRQKCPKRRVKLAQWQAAVVSDLTLALSA